MPLFRSKTSGAKRRSAAPRGSSAAVAPDVVAAIGAAIAAAEGLPFPGSSAAADQSRQMAAALAVATALEEAHVMPRPVLVRYVAPLKDPAPLEPAVSQWLAAGRARQMAARSVHGTWTSRP